MKIIKEIQRNVLVLITPDGERTMCTYLGCASNITLSNLNLNEIVNSKLLYLEGYSWDVKETILSLQKIIAFAKNKNIKIAMSLSDLFCVERHNEAFYCLAKDDLNILFGNKKEVANLLKIDEIGENNYHKLTDFVQSSNLEIMLITCDKDGCLIITNDTIERIDSNQVSVKDSTGAGDSFAAGFLYGYLQEKEHHYSAKIANNLAEQIVQYPGARPEIDDKYYKAI